MPGRKRPTDRYKRRYKAYKEEDMIKAIEEVRNGAASKKVAERFNINRTTLMNHVKGYKCKKVGRPTVLSEEEEELLVHSLVKLGEWGYGFDRIQLRLTVQDFCRRMDRKNPFTDGLPGNDWCTLFEKRWKTEISRRVAQNLPKNRATAGAPDVMNDFYTKLESLLSELDIKNKPENIYNCDETGFQTDAGQQKVLCKRGSRNPTKLVGSVTKASYTVLSCCNAAGDFLPMFINYKGLHLYTTWCVGGPDNARYNCSPSGWMESAQFLDWFINCFVPAASKQEGKKLLIYDGHNSHISIELIEAATKNDIAIFCLPAHTSHLLQPLDVGVFKAVKQSWRNVLRQYYQESGYKNVDKIVFPTLMRKLCDSGAFSRANAVGGFEGSGIYPISEEKIMGKVYFTTITSDTDVPLADQAASTSMNINPHQIAGDAITTKTALELSLLSILKPKQVTSNDKEKKSRISRKFAESLTEPEVQQRLTTIANQKKEQLVVKKKIKSKNKHKKAKRDISSSESETDKSISIVLESEHEFEDFDDFLDPDNDTNAFSPGRNKIDVREKTNWQEKQSKANMLDLQELTETNSMRSVEIPENINNKKYDEGSWIIAKYGNSYYVGKVINLNNESQEIKVQFLRKKSLYFVFPDVEDTMTIPLDNVEQKLEDPVVNRGKHYFKLTNIQLCLKLC